MKSIQRTLTLTLLAANLSLVVIAGAALYFYLRHSLSRQFDELLSAEARRLTGMVQRDETGKLEFSFINESTPASATSPVAEPTTAPASAPTKILGRGIFRQYYYELYRDSGGLLVRSHSLGMNHLSVVPPKDWAPRCWTATLPNGDTARITAVRFVPLQESEPDSSGKPATEASTQPLPPSEPLILVVGEDRIELYRTLRILLTAVFAVAAMLSIAVALVVPLAVRRGLEPLVLIADQTQRIGVTTLDYRFGLDGLAREVRPICDRLNNLLQRLQDAFQRENRFTADVAHELRTPIAELRSLTEVALKFPEDPSAAPIVYQEALDIAQQMEAVVTTLLAIARCEAGGQSVQSEALDLCQIVGEAWIPFRGLARERELTVLSHLPPEAPITSDHSMLLQLLGNLVSNAAIYARKGSSIDCSLRRNEDRWELSISNENDTLEQEDLEHLFEPFWRKDPARSVGAHAGLGLSIVGAYVDALHGTIKASLPRPDVYRVTVSLPRDPNLRRVP